MGQKASSAKECIKTRRLGGRRGRRFLVREHRAPKGALRLAHRPLVHATQFCVRKHQAPKGVLRLMSAQTVNGRAQPRQKAPSAKRCIKTCRKTTSRCLRSRRQKAPSAKRYIKTVDEIEVEPFFAASSESTERQKVH